jgi:hypothetical protein
MNLQAQELQDIAQKLPWTRPSTERVLRIRSAIMAAPRPERRPRWHWSVVAAGVVAAAASFVVFVRPAPRQAVVVEPSAERAILAEPMTAQHSAPVLAVPEPERGAPSIVAAPSAAPELAAVEGRGESAVAADRPPLAPIEQSESSPVMLESQALDRDHRAAPEPAPRADKPALETKVERDKDGRELRLERRELRQDRKDRRLERHQKRVDRHAR